MNPDGTYVCGGCMTVTKRNPDGTYVTGLVAQEMKLDKI
jgi:hypothetical protein